MPKKESNLKDDMRREEVRGVFTLGLMAVLVAVKLGLFGKIEIISLPIAHIGTITFQIDIPVSIIDVILITWGLYAFSMVFAYSSDILPPGICDWFKKLGQTCLMLSLVMIVLFVILIVLTNPMPFIYDMLIAVSALLLYVSSTRIYRRIKKIRFRKKKET